MAALVISLLHALQHLLQLALLVQLVQDVAARPGGGRTNKQKTRSERRCLRSGGTVGYMAAAADDDATAAAAAAAAAADAASQLRGRRHSGGKASGLSRPAAATVQTRPTLPTAAHLPPTNSPLMKICGGVRKRGAKSAAQACPLTRRDMAGHSSCEGPRHTGRIDSNTYAPAQSRSQPPTALRNTPAGWWASA